MDDKEKKLKSSIKQAQFNESLKVIQWNQILMSTLGLWPATPNNFLFFLTFIYYSYEMILEYFDLLFFINDPEHVILNLTENMAFSQIFIRIFMLRLHNRKLGELIREAKKDFNIKKYSSEEQEKFIAYYSKSKLFFKFLTINTALTASSYYIKPTLEQMDKFIEYAATDSNEIKNSTLIFVLPYRFYTFYPVKNMSTYIWTYISQLPFVFISGFGQSAADCIMVTLVYHVSGQMNILAMRISRINTDSSIQCTKQLHQIVRDHARIGKSIREAFSIILFGNLMSATALICILGYQILISLAEGEKTVLVSFFIFIVLVLLVLYVHCTVGESLITESTRVCEAFYNCRWYSMSKKNAEIIVLCMARSQKPLQLTAGKFCMFCLTTFTNSVKASMGYLSFLKAVM